MGTQISDIVAVTITRETARITRAGFGTPLFLSEFSNLQNRVTSYSDPADMLVDGFITTDEAYKAAIKIMSQELSPQTFKIGRKKVAINDLQTITLDALASAGTFTVTVGTQTTAAIAYDAITPAIETAIELLSNVASVTWTGVLDTDLVCTIEFDGGDAETEFPTISLDVAGLTTTASATVVHTQWGAAADTSWIDALNAVIAEDQDFYCLLAETRTKSEILELAAVIETKTMIYLSSSDDTDAKTNASSDIASSLQALSYDRTSYLWSGDAANYPEAAWAGGQLPKDPGSITWKFKTLVGIVADTLTTGELGFLSGKNASFYENAAGISMITSEAVVAGGEFIDIIRGVDWLQVRMSERIFTRLANADKVPMTNVGIGSIETDMRNQLDQGVDVGLITNDYVLDIPDISEVDSADRASRHLKTLRFTATLQGAIHKVTINGKVVV